MGSRLVGDPAGGFLPSGSCRRILSLTQTRHPSQVTMIGWLDENEFSALDTWHLSWLPSSTLRVWLILGILYYYRALTMFITVLPKPDETYICAPKVSHLYKDVHCNDADKCFIAPLPPFRCLFSLMKKGTWSVHRQIGNWQFTFFQSLFLSRQEYQTLTDVKKMFDDASWPHSPISFEISVFSSDGLNFYNGRDQASRPTAERRSELINYRESSP